MCLNILSIFLKNPQFQGQTKEKLVNDDLNKIIENPIKVKIENYEKECLGLDKLKVQRSLLPAITHVDCSARIQTVNKDTNPKYFELLAKFKEITNCPVLVNTSFNVRGEPIVCTPQDAYRWFMRTEMDYLLLNNQIYLHQFHFVHYLQYLK